MNPAPCHAPVRVRHISLFLLIFASLVVVGCGPQQTDTFRGDAWEEVRQQGSGTLKALYVPSGGFAYETEEGELTGVTVEIVREFGRWVEATYDVSLNIDFEEEPDWQRFYQRVAHAEEGVIGMGNVTITKARMEELQFSPPYLSNIAVLISHEDRPELTSMDAIPEVFDNHVALVFPGTLHEERIETIREEYYPNLSTDIVSSNNEIMERISAEDRYFTYVDVYNFVHAREQGAPVMRHDVGDDATEEFGYIMPLESDWHSVVVEFFEQNDGFVQSDTYREILSEHVGQELVDLLLN